MRVNFTHKGRERQIFEKLFKAIVFALRVFAKKICLDEVVEEIFFHISYVRAEVACPQKKKKKKKNGAEIGIYFMKINFTLHLTFNFYLKGAAKLNWF